MVSDVAKVVVFDVVRRDGTVVSHDRKKLVEAVTKCLQASATAKEKTTLDALAKKDLVKLVAKIVTFVETVAVEISKQDNGQAVSVEVIGKVCVQALMESKLYEAAIRYLRYSDEKNRNRKRALTPDLTEAFDVNAKYFDNPIQRFQALDKFARFIPEKGRRENWEETVDRTVNFFREHCQENSYLVDNDTWESLKDSLLNLKAAPSMRCVQMAGPALKRCHVGVYNCAFQFLQNTKDMAEELYILMQGTGVGFSVEAEFTVEKFPRVKRQKKNQTPLPVHVVEDNTEGWCNAYELGLNTWFNGEDIEFDYSQVRKEGTPLKTKGGKASGPGPLKDLLEFARKRILAKQGRYLSSLDLHDINCYAHRIVKMGGVRRASGISLSDLKDNEMRDCKRGEFWNINDQRNQANNSAVYAEKPSDIEWMEEWLALAKSGSGERGIFNRGALKDQFPKRRKYNGHLFGTNPCVTADTWVPTENGPKQVSQLLDDPFVTFVDGVARQASNFFQTGVKPVFLLQLKNGMQQKLTEDHEVRVVTYRTNKVQRTDWKKLKDVKPGDLVVLHNHRELTTWAGTGTRKEGWLLGNLLGDGCFGSKDNGILDYWGETREHMTAHALELVHSTVGARSDCNGSNQIATVGKTRVQSANLGKLASKYKLGRDKLINAEIEQTSADFHSGFLSGWFDADGSVQGTQAKGVSVRLSSSIPENLQAAQRMLLRLGINSTIYYDRRPEGDRPLPDGKGGNKDYHCKASHDLVIANNNLKYFRERVGFSDTVKTKSLDLALSNYKRKHNRERFAEVVESITPAGTEPVYDVQVPGPNAFDANGMYVHNCGEIILRHKQFCNLSIAVIRPEDTLEEIKEKVKLAAIWGTLQSTMTNFNYIGDEWKKNSEEEKLLGVDLLGFLDHSLFQNNDLAASTLKELRDLVNDTNAQWAAKLGINVSAATTCIKPSGDSSVLFATAAGFKGHHGRYYVRRTRSSPSNPVAQMLKEAGVPCHTDYDGNGLVLEWPMKSPENGVLLRDQTALSQLEQWKTFKTSWTEHNPSVTIYVRDNEWVTVGKWVYDNWDIIGGLSFLPYDGGIYHLAPYEEITEEDYKARMESFPQINWAKLVQYEVEDMTDLQHQFACTGDKCTL
jgi:ribonucleotide reductase alpha subunit